MRIIQTFWTQNNKANSILIKGGWLSNEAFYMCWALSCLNAKKHYGNIELYTDKGGYDVLIKQFNLPYDKVHIVFTDEISKKIPEKLWSLSKIYTYSLQKEPFIHIDGDFIFWEKINFDNKLLFQNLEKNDIIYKNSYDFIKSVNNKIEKKSFAECVNTPYISRAVNMGIFGCKDTSFSKQYSHNVFQFVDFLKSGEIDNDQLTSLNIFIEQYYVHYLCKQKEIKYNTIHPEILEKTPIPNNIFFDRPNSYVPFNHFLGNSKRFEQIDNYVAQKLHLLYPQYYKRIYEVINNKLNMEFFYFNKRNKKIDVQKIHTFFNQKLSAYKVNLSNQFEEDFISFYNKKHSLLNEIVDKQNNKPSIKKIKIDKKFFESNAPEDIKIKLTNYIFEIKKYYYPWDLVFDNVKNDLNNGNLSPFLVLDNKVLNEKKFYCLFYLSNFQNSISTFWVKDIVAFIVIRILSNKYQNLTKINNLIKTALNIKTISDFEKTKSVLTDFLIKLYYYDLIQIKIN